MDIPTQQKAEKAQAMLEFALTVPILLFLILGIIDLARILFGFNQVVDASRQAVRYGIVDGLDEGRHQYLDCAGIRNQASQLPGLLRIQASDITIKYENSKGDTTLGECTTTGPSIWTVNNGEVLAVTVQGSIRPLTPILAMFDDSIEFNYTSRRTIQGEGAAYTSEWPTPPQKPSSFDATVTCGVGSDSTNVSYTWSWSGGTAPQQAEIRNAITGDIVKTLNATEAAALSCTGCTGIASSNGFAMYYLVAVSGSYPSTMAGPPSEVKTVYCDPTAISGTTIRGYVFEDTKTADGILGNGEKGKGGVIVTLTDPGADGLFDSLDDTYADPDGFSGSGDEYVDAGPDGVISSNDDMQRMVVTSSKSSSLGEFTFTGLVIPTGTTRPYKITVAVPGLYPTLPTSEEYTTAALAPDTAYNTANNPYVYMGWDTVPHY